MNLLPVLFCMLTLGNAYPQSKTCSGNFSVPEAPDNPHSFMISDDYAEISWDAAEAAEAYRIQIRKGEGEMVLEEQTVWTSFYFRVAEPGTAYAFRLAILADGRQGNWSAWMPLRTTSAGDAPAIVQKH